MATQFQVTFDAHKPGVLADFWAAALGYEPFRLPAKYVEWVKSWGGDPAERKYEAWIVDPDRLRPTLYFQIVPEEKRLFCSIRGSVMTTGRATMGSSHRA